MKKIVLMFGLVFSLVSTAAFAISDISPAEANKLVEEGKAVLIDVREKSEVQASGLAKPAIWLPLSEIKNESDHYKNTLKALDKEKVVIFYCASGGRASAMEKKFAEMSYKTKNAGGFSEWTAAKLPVRSFDEKSK